MSSSSSSSSPTGSAAASGNESDVGSTVVAKPTSSNTGDSCTWYADESCSRPRTGSDCLNVLLSTDDCAIDPTGACVSMSVYEEYLANRQYYEPAARYFPSSEYSYCNATDSVCSACISRWTWSYNNTGTAGSTTYCTGSDGCVCVADCEISHWETTVISDQCSSSSSSGDSSFSSGTRICIAVAVGLCVAMVCAVIAVRRCIRQAGARLPAGPHSVPHPPPSGPQLALSGWKSLRESLIATEKTFVTGEAVTLDATTRDAEAAPATSALVVQVGEGYRPAAPDADQRRAN